MVAVLEDSQEMAAESKMGELLKNIPKKGNRYGSSGGTIPSLPEGISKKQSYFAQKLYENRELIKTSNRTSKRENDGWKERRP